MVKDPSLQVSTSPLSLSSLNYIVLSNEIEDWNEGSGENDFLEEVDPSIVHQVTEIT